jgi:Ion channel
MSKQIPIEKRAAWQSLVLTGSSVVLLAFIYVPGGEKLGSILDAIAILFCLLWAIPAIHNARDVMHQKQFLVPILATFALLMFLVLAFAAAYKDLGLLAGNKPVTDPGEFIYFSIVTWTTTGYGDVIPTAASRFFAGVEMLCGYIFMGVIIGMMIQAMFWSGMSSNIAGGSTYSDATPEQHGSPLQHR